MEEINVKRHKEEKTGKTKWEIKAKKITGADYVVEEGKLEESMKLVDEIKNSKAVLANLCSELKE